MLTNEVIPLQELLKVEAVAIQEKLVLAPTNTDKIEIVETFLLKLLTGVNQKYCLNPLLEEMIKFHGQISIASLANKFQLSTRKLERLFKEQVGVSPKVYARIIRFKHIFNLMQQSHVSRGEAAYLCGYFDQPHFNKDFKDFSGVDPQRYFGQTHPFADFFLNR